ncbi:hypothetical protein ALP94_02355 [Pseudomonas savastanoi pv. glycinea]|uniref:hypothetical protein n=1 Tax=Pseudomonas quasicaspiana TaxID=2829821 RepID=UPI000EFF9D3E|nr:hypothetical protein [Pseudomonas quasicaspiana]MCD5978022.1 hypothetical protein [Pseudomonas quasicaspiana]RMQ95923.1 hypothetical protein ALP94_02355 [Pseudomonas savastanoi pv. glycinea]
MNTQHRSLVAPTIPVAQPDGLIKTSDLIRDVIVYFPIWEDARLGDSYQLLLTGLPIGDVKLISESELDPNLELNLTIPIEHLDEDGVYSVAYQITAYPGGGTADSNVKRIQIDRTPAGGPLLGPMLLPDHGFGMLRGKIPSYAGMEPGDLIQTVCNGMQGPTYRVQTENLTTSPIEISFTQEFLEGLFSDRVNITYHVTDRAGNRSILAQSVEITMQR